MNIRTTTLAENTAGGGLGEWGLSILVETDEGVVLLDTGGLELSAAHNAQRLGKDLTMVDTIVLSHGHIDHTGGLVEILKQIRKSVDIIAHPAIWAPKYVKFPDSPARYAGMPFRVEMLESLGASFTLTTAPMKITETIMTTGEIDMQTDYEDIDDILFEKRNGDLQPDTVPDDLALVITTGEGLIVMTGCAHRGIVNTLRHAQNMTGVDRIHTVIGGTHLFRASDERLECTIRDLKAFDIQRLGVSHCTGNVQAARLAHEFGDRFFFNNAGTSLVLD